MTLDVHTLDQVLLVGTGVLLLGILAVRLSVGVGLPSLLLYLLMGVALGSSGLGLQFDDALTRLHGHRLEDFSNARKVIHNPQPTLRADPGRAR